MEESANQTDDKADLPRPYPLRDHFPLCIVWTPIPLLTWILPFVGHLGIATSEGMIHDFVGPYTINKNMNHLGFGTATKYLQIDLEQIRGSGVREKIKAYDDAIERSSAAFEHIIHNLFWNNCHSHVARALNELEYMGRKNWNTTFLIILMITHAHFVSFGRFVRTYAGIVVLVILFLIIFFVFK